MSNPIHVVATLEPRPGQEAEAERVLRGMVGPSRAEAGCLQYDLFRSAAEPAALVIAECYRDSAALEAHRESAHYKAYRAAIGDLLGGPIRVQVLAGLDVKLG